MTFYNDVMSYQCVYSTSVPQVVSKVLSVPSSASPGALQVRILTSVGALDRRGELDNQPDRLDHGLSPLELFSQMT